MLLEQIRLRHFRNYEELSIQLAPGINVLVGENAQGKSNLLEAIYLLATTKSFRAARESETIRWGAEEAVVQGTVRRADGLTGDVAISLSRTERKVARINGATADKAVDILGLLRAVVFGALDLRLITGEPETRRRYMDLAISQTTPAYCSDLSSYKRVLAHRNHLLKRLRDSWYPESGLDAWNVQLALYGARLIARRRHFVAELAEACAAAHSELSGGTENLTVRYVSSPAADDAVSTEEIEHAIERALQLRSDEELRRGTTLAGPQRDDLRFAINGREVRTYGSQGQQRTAVLSLKIAELNFIEDHTGEPPVMLLDDVMSDLDDDRRTRLMERVRNRCQIFLTCTNLRGIPRELLAEARVFRISAGTVSTEAG